MLGPGKVCNHASMLPAHRFLSSKRKLHRSPREAIIRGRTSTVGPTEALASDAPIQTGRQEEKATIVDSPYRGKTAIVVGAGPAGSVTGMLLAKRGFNVKVIEKRSRPSSKPGVIQRSIGYIITPEVANFLVELGIDVATNRSEPGVTKFVQSHTMTKQGKLIANPRTTQQLRLYDERHALLQAILNLGLSQDLPNLEYIFNSACQDIDVDSRVAKFSAPDGEIAEFHYDLLVGADGINSRVRDALEFAGCVSFWQRNAASNYISIRDLPLPKEASKEFLEALSLGNLIIGELTSVWGGPDTFFIYQTKNGLVQGNLGGRKGCFEAIRGRELEWLTKAAPDCFPKEYYQPIVEQMRGASPSLIGPVTYCEPYIGVSEALVGDACHSATPTLGIGANRAILDARDLDEALGNSQGDVAKGLRLYDEKCRPQVAAIQQLEAALPNAALEGMSPVWGIFMRCYLKFYMDGSRLLPGIIPKSAFTLMGTSVLTPVEALAEFRRSLAIWGAGAAFTAVGMVATLVVVLSP